MGVRAGGTGLRLEGRWGFDHRYVCTVYPINNDYCAFHTYATVVNLDGLNSDMPNNALDLRTRYNEIESTPRSRFRSHI